MEIRMEHTAGLGKLAEVWADARLLTVCDGVSAPDRPKPPGVLQDVEFRYATMSGFSWREAVGEYRWAAWEMACAGSWRCRSL